MAASTSYFFVVIIMKFRCAFATYSLFQSSYSSSSSSVRRGNIRTKHIYLVDTDFIGSSCRNLNDKRNTNNYLFSEFGETKYTGCWFSPRYFLPGTWYIFRARTIFPRLLTYFKILFLFRVSFFFSDFVSCCCVAFCCFLLLLFFILWCVSRFDFDFRW